MKNHADTLDFRKDVETVLGREITMNQIANIEELRGQKEADRQKAMRLMEALSGVDGELLERSGKSRGVLPFFRYERQLAACLVLLVMGAGALGVYSVTNGQMKKSGGAAPMAAGEAAASADGSRAAYDMESAALEQAPAEMPGGAYAALNGGAGASDVAGGTEMKQVDVSEDGGSAGKKQVQNASNAAGGAAQKPEEGKAESVATGQGEGNLAIDTGKVLTPQDNRPEITMQEARAMERIGGYVPGKVPTGYTLESVRGSIPAGNYLEMTLLWSRGMDDISLHITEYYAAASMPKEISDRFQKRMADPTKPETYDVHLYEIPYAETVPMEYFEVFHTPVFRESDFSLELVKARMKSVPDAGDTDTPRGNFAVLYDSGILVEFSGRGSVQDIWEMFASICP